MNDTVELWTLRDDNAELRRELTEAQRQRDEAEAACAAMRPLLEMFASLMNEAVPSDSEAGGIWLPSSFSTTDVEDEIADVLKAEHGRDFLARLEAAQRTAQAADGLAERIKKEMSYPHWTDDQRRIFELCLKWLQEQK